MRRNIIIVFLLLCGVMGSAQDRKLVLKITNISPIGGEMYISLYNNAEVFLEKGKEYRKECVKIMADTMDFCFKDLSEGEYAIALFHDKNKDGKCNRNWLGIPKEGYAFSNNFKPKFSAPSFRKVKFKVDKNQELQIKVINP